MESTNATTKPLVWDFYRKIENESEPCGVVHYYTEESQSLYLKNSLNTKISYVPKGHWEESKQSDSICIDNQTWKKARIDHPSNGIVYGAAVIGDKTYFIRYIYSLDISNYISSWSLDCQNDSPINQVDMDIINYDYDLFNDESSIFQPGSKVELGVQLGNSEIFPIQKIWLDEISYGKTDSNVNISGRNSIGFKLYDQTFDDNVEYNADTYTVFTDILDYAGITDYDVCPIDSVIKVKFKPDDTLLSGINKIIDTYDAFSNKLKMCETIDGKVCIGYEEWLQKYNPTNKYVFVEGRDCYSVNTDKSIDGSYTSIRVTGKGPENENGEQTELTPVIIPVKSFKYWNLALHKTLHLTCPTGMTQSEMTTWATNQAETYKYVGIKKEYSGPFKPYLVVGDAAIVEKESEQVIEGIITSVEHSFSIANGFKTNFSVDSGGIIKEQLSRTVCPNPSVYTSTPFVWGLNRTGKLADMIKEAADSTFKYREGKNISKPL